MTHLTGQDLHQLRNTSCISSPVPFPQSYSWILLHCSWGPSHCLMWLFQLPLDMPIPWVFLLSLPWVCKLALLLFIVFCVLSQWGLTMIWKSLISFSHFSDGDSWISQDQLSSTRNPNKTVHISCKLSGVPLQNTIVHWYQMKEGESLKRIFYGSAKNYKQDKPNSRLEAYENDGTFYLIINNVITADEATYYCACWDLTVSHYLKEPVRKPSYPHSSAALTVPQPPRTLSAHTHRMTGVRTGRVLGTHFFRDSLQMRKLEPGKGKWLVLSQWPREVTGSL